MRIPIISGIYTDNGPDFRSAYPVNMVPVPLVQGVSEGYLRPADGIVSLGAGPGDDRGGVNWNGTLYRVMGPYLVTVAADGTVTEIGRVNGTGRVTFDYGFTHLAVATDGQLWLYDGTTLAQVTDTDLGTVVDVVWIDGYFMTTDGEFLTVTELNDPFAVDPLKYGSSEANPDPVVGLLRLRNEVYALNRYTIEVFSNVGGGGFPFSRVVGAQIQKGTVGTHACCVFMDGIAFVGSGFGEAPAVYIGANGSATKVSTIEIDRMLAGYTEADLATAFVDARVSNGQQHLQIRLPDKAIVFDAGASQAFGQPVWFIYSTSLDGDGAWQVSDTVWCYDRWNVGRPNSASLGYLDATTPTHWGNVVGWQFMTPIVYNGGAGALVHDLELVALPGRAEGSPVISTEYSNDGVTWSQPKWINAGREGQRTKRLRWLQHGRMANWRVQRFKGTSDARLSFAALEARVEPLAF